MVKKKRKCSQCKKAVDDKGDFVALLTFKKGKEVSGSYYHFSKCWVAYFNGCVEKRLDAIKGKLLGAVKETVGKVDLGSVLKGLAGIGNVFKK